MSLTQNKYDYLKLGIAGFLSTVTEMFFFSKKLQMRLLPSWKVRLHHMVY